MVPAGLDLARCPGIVPLIIGARPEDPRRQTTTAVSHASVHRPAASGVLDGTAGGSRSSPNTSERSSACGTMGTAIGTGTGAGTGTGGRHPISTRPSSATRASASRSAVSSQPTSADIGLVRLAPRPIPTEVDVRRGVDGVAGVAAEPDHVTEGHGAPRGEVLGPPSRGGRNRRTRRRPDTAWPPGHPGVRCRTRRRRPPRRAPVPRTRRRRLAPRADGPKSRVRIEVHPTYRSRLRVPSR